LARRIATNIVKRSPDELKWECLLLAQSGHFVGEFQCPLSGAKRTSHVSETIAGGGKPLSIADLLVTHNQASLLFLG